MKSPLLIIALLLAQIFAFSQSGVGINGNGASPHSSSILDVSSTDKGLLIPRMTSAQRDLISSPAQSLQIYNTTTKCFEFYENNVWNVLSCGCATPAQAGPVSGTSSVCEGQAGVVYSITPVIGAIGYVWSLPTGASISSGFNSTSITVSYAMGASSGNISVYAVSQSCGNGPASANFPVTVNSLLPASVSIGVSPSSTICSGVNVTFTATPVNGGPTPSYQWKVNGSNVGTNSATYSTTSLTNGAVVTCVMTSSICASGSPATSNGITMTVNPSPPPVVLPSTFTGKQSFVHTGATQTFNVPACVTQVYVKLWGAGGAGGNDGNTFGGAGAYVGGFMSVTPGQQLTVIAGGQGTRNTGGGTAPGGFGGGGASGSSSGGSNGGGWFAGSGGGRSAIQVTPGTDHVTAGGGGGSGGIGWNSQRPFGGGGGATTGGDGGDGNTGPSGPGRGRGGTISAGGAGSTGGTANSSAGSALQGSAGASSGYGGGGGGGGYFGGSGGAGISPGPGTIGGGGGGSSFTSNLTSVANIAGAQGQSGGPWTGPNSSDVDYVSGVANGGNVGGNGGHGRVVIIW